ncbi:LOW QUALITY PROTEIN: protein POF1B [Dermochelys coriacea]|uniref:LOW QUALITY PROTEIN: protein POF1B n=1 Tax=Dermochelys coriacea TaxID=27794 RepID=UPI001CA9E3B0|nr:LOW QUALITY PROTEIN: protein POF1B [Dermochelys coriacea]
MYGDQQQQLQTQALPPHLQQHHRPQPCYNTLPLPRHRPRPCPDPPPLQSRPRPCLDPPPLQSRPRPCPDPPPLQSRPRPCLDPPPLQSRPRPCPEPLPSWPQQRPEPLPKPCPELQPHQQHQHQDGNVVYERVRTYRYPGGRRGQVLELPPCSPRAVSPLEDAPGHQRVIWSRDPPQQLQEPLSPFLKGESYCPGNNVIYEKTIRKYELLNPEQEKQYRFSQSNQSQVNQVCQQSEQPQIIHKCQETQSCSPCEISSISVSDGGRGTNTVQRVTIQCCEPVQCLQEANDQLDSRYFGELLAEVNARKSNDLYSCLLQHVEKIGRRDTDNESTSQVEDIEGLIPKGLSELTKQQIRYLLQMRVTSDKSLRLVLSTFGSLRGELCHLQDDLGKLETDKMLLEKDLAFKESQVKEYEMLLASMRENNRQQQQGFRDSAAKCRSLEEQIISLRYAEGEKDCRLKELEYCKHALEQEIQNLRMKTCSNPVMQTTTDELSSRYVEMINNLREDKDREIRNLRSQINQFQQDISRRDGSNSDFQMRLHELTSMLEEKETFIKQQQEELFRLKQERLSCSQSTGVTKSIITKKYLNQYPILGLLSNDYMVSSPVRQTETIVIEKTEAM